LVAHHLCPYVHSRPNDSPRNLCPPWRPVCSRWPLPSPSGRGPSSTTTSKRYAKRRARRRRATRLRCRPASLAVGAPAAASPSPHAAMLHIYRRPLTSPSPVITNALLGNNADTMRRLQHRVDHHGDAPAAALPRPARTAAPFNDMPVANDYSATNGYPSNAAPSPYQQPQLPARMHL
jgi:hypothetical protein